MKLHRIPPRRFPEGYLQQQWIDQNEKIAANMLKKYDLEYMPREKSDRVWQFLYNRSEMQNKLGEGYFVSTYFILKSKQDGRLYTCTIWTEHIPVVLPPADYVIIDKKYKKLFRNVEESGWVAYEEVMNKLGSYFDDFDHAVPGLKIIQPASAEKAGKIFNALKVQSLADGFKVVGLDAFVNVQPLSSE